MGAGYLCGEACTGFEVVGSGGAEECDNGRSHAGAVAEGTFAMDRSVGLVPRLALLDGFEDAGGGWSLPPVPAETVGEASGEVTWANVVVGQQ